jgi:hypothetical protein
MDTASIATLVTTLLTPFLPYLLKGGEKAIEEAGKQVGSEAWQKAKAVWTALFPKLKGQPDTLIAAENVARAPADNRAQNDLSAQLKEILDKDEALATQIANLTLYDSSTRATASAEHSSAFAGDITHSHVIAGSHITMTGDGNIIGQNNYSNLTKVNAASEPATLKAFSELLKQLREELPKVDLEYKIRESIDTDIQAVEAEAKESKPSLPIIEGKLKSVESIIKRVAGIGSATMALTPMLQKAIELSARLFA